MTKSEKLFDKGWKLLIKKSNPERGIEYMHRAAEAGSEAAVLLLAELYNKGSLSLGTEDGVGEINAEKDEARALNMLEQLPQTELISYIEALKYYNGAPEIKKDYNKAYKLFKNIADGKTEPDFEDIALLYDFEYGGRTKETDEQIKRTASMYAGVMQFFGRGAQKDDAAAYMTLLSIDENRKKDKIRTQDYWLPEHAFVLEVLKYNNAAEDRDFHEREYSKSDFDKLMWMLRENSDPQIVKILAERLIAPPLELKLKNAAAAKQLKEINMCAKLTAEIKAVTAKTDWQLLKAADEALIYYGEPEPSDGDAALYEDTLTVLSKAGDLMATVMLAHFELNASQDIEDGAAHYKDKREVDALISDSLGSMAEQISEYANTDPADDEYALKTLKNGLNAAGQFLREYREEAEHADRQAYELARIAYFGEDDGEN